MADNAAILAAAQDLATANATLDAAIAAHETARLAEIDAANAVTAARADAAAKHDALIATVG